MQKFDVAILGAGMSGLSYARMLKQHCPHKTFVVIEKSDTPGGLCRTKKVNGLKGDNHIDTGGGHFLHSKYNEVYDFIFDLVPQNKWNRFDRVTKIQIHDQHIDYPIEQNLWQLPREIQKQYIDSLNSIMDDIHIDDSAFRRWIISNLGKAICENYMIPYNEKIWGIPVDDLGMEWMNKLPKVDVNKILASLSMERADNSIIPSHNYFFYPKEGGYQCITDALYEKVKEHVRLNTPVIALVFDPAAYAWKINGEIFATQVINTIPWPALGNTLYHPNLSKLKHTSLAVSVHQRKGVAKNNWHWCYIPDRNGYYHREFYVNNYAVSNCDDLVARETTVKHTHGSHPMPYRSGAHNDPNLLEEFVNPYGYPIPVAGFQKDISEILEFFAPNNLHGLGRWGQWQYFNSDVCVRQAMELFNRLEKPVYELS